MNCPACDKPYSEWTEDRTKVNAIFGVEWGICSDACVKTYVSARAMYLAIKFMKESQVMPFEKFAETFQFGIEGGYAADKFRKLRENPFLFMCSLSHDKYVLLIKDFRF